MFSITPLGLVWITSFCGMLLILSLLFAFRDVVQGFREFFDVRLLRRHYSSLFGSKRGFRLALGGVPVALVALAALLIVEPEAAYGACGTVFAVYVLLSVGSTTYLFFSDALSFGPGPRRDYGDRPIHVLGSGITFFPNVTRLRRGKPPIRRCGKNIDHQNTLTDTGGAASWPCRCTEVPTRWARG